MNVVSDSTVLIFLGKLNKLCFLKENYDKILIPGKVFYEVVEQGKRLGETDAVLVEEAIEEGWIEVREVSSNERIVKFGLEEGETDTLSLAIKLQHEEVLVDEESVREVARIMDLKPKGTLFFLLNALRSAEIDFEIFLELLEELINSGFYINESVYSMVVRKAKKISKE